MADIVKAKVGTVVSDKMQKTIVVRVETLAEHPLYKKRVRQSTKFKAHDENNDAHIGDLVRIVESRPYSKEKTWRLDAIVRPAQGVTVGQE
jgi:small subunit ribosomal protein S17